MYIKSIELENFRCISKLHVEMPKLLVLTGANSSGKSSFIYSILGALQAKSFPLYFSPNGQFVEMGDFHEISRNHKNSAIIAMNYEISEKKTTTKYESTWVNDDDNKMPKLNSLRVTNGIYEFTLWKTETDYRVRLENISKYSNKIGNDEDSDELTKVLLEFVKKINNTDFESNTKLLTIEAPVFEFSGKSIDDIVKTINSKQIGNKLITDIARDITERFSGMSSQINYISSFRKNPERTYYQKTGQPDTIGKYGENCMDIINHWERYDQKKYEQLLGALKKLHLVESISTKHLAGGRYEIMVKPFNSRINASILDVGFGICQFLPIIVSDIQLGKQSTLIMSQPEIHLHPSVQAEFANYLVEKINSNEKRYIIETHSEYLINRLRYLIVNKRLKPNDVNVVFFSNEPTFKAHFIDLTTDGQIRNAPNEFFETYQMDIMNIALES
jgi:predicted ATPase